MDWGTVRIVSVGINVGGSTGNSNVDIAIIGATDVGMSGVGDASIGNAGVVGTGVGGGGASVEVVGVGVACGRSIGVGVAGGSSTSVQRWHWQRRRGWGLGYLLAIGEVGVFVVGGGRHGVGLVGLTVDVRH